MHLDIEFLDGDLDMEVGARGRIKVSQSDAHGVPHAIGLGKVKFAFEPIAWGKVTALDEPGVGLLEVVAVVESDDLLLAPTYDIAATLMNDTRRTLRTERRVRLLATAVEIEIGFEVGQKDKWQRFEPNDLKQPIDWTKVELSDPSRMSIVLRDGRPHLRLTEPEAFPGWVALTMPNGERVHMSFEGSVVSHRPDDPQPEPKPVAAPAAMAASAVQPRPAQPAPAAPDDPREAAFREAQTVIEPAPVSAPEPARAAPVIEETEDEDVEVPQPPELGSALAAIQSLRSYVASFAGSQEHADPDVRTRIEARVQSEVQRVWELIEGAAGEARAELETLFHQATDPLPVARRTAQALTR